MFPVITMDLTGTKVVVLVLLGLIKLASGLLPLVLTRILRRKSDRGLRKFIGQSVVKHSQSEKTFTKR